MKIVVAVDKMKGSLSAEEFARTCCNALLRGIPGCECLAIPLADGGDGTVAAVGGAIGGKIVECGVSGPLGGKVTARYMVSPDGHTAVMEMAAASGLVLVDEGRRNPMLTTSYGTGEMILDAIHRGCRRICMGLGGSATNDAGMGMLRALGYIFKDYAARALEGNGASLLRVEEIDDCMRNPRLNEISFVAACDVDNPLFGPRGAARVFAGQKGATPEMVAALDKGLRNFGRVVAQKYGIDMQAIPGAGAAGGMGGAFAAFLKGELKPGVEMVFEALDFDNRIAGADLILTGEGSLDGQSLMGKTVSGVLAHAKRYGIPVVGIAGRVCDKEELLASGFKSVYEISKKTQTLAEAMRMDVAESNIEDVIRNHWREFL